MDGVAEHLLTDELNVDLVCLVVDLFQLDEEHGRGEALGRQGRGHDQALRLGQGEWGALDRDVARRGRRGDGARA